jgi:ABC-type antimicrobial peptide transport system permease subunit
MVSVAHGLGRVYQRYQPMVDSVRFSLYLLWQRKSPMVGLVIVLALIGMVIFAPVLTPYQPDDYTEIGLGA